MRAPTPSSSLEHWLVWLERLSAHEIDFGLARVQQVLERMHLPSPERVLTVGGTNGKGSSVMLLSDILRRDGRIVGSYLSPHVEHYCERVCINGDPVDEAEMVAAFAAVEQVRDGVPLTYFEFGTLAALAAFHGRNAHTWVLEVGLGGRLDAVNAVEPDAVLITNVSLDHCEWLGSDVESIAREKAGIMRRHKPVVFGARSVPDAIRDEATRLQAELIVAGRDFDYERQTAGGWQWQGRTRALERLPSPALSGAHQLDNAAAVLALLEAAGETTALAPASVVSALAETVLVGRQQHVTADGVDWLLDGAHNAAGAAALAASLRERGEGTVLAILGVLDDKDVEAIVGSLAPEVDRWIACRAQSPRALAAEHLAARIANLSGLPCRIEGSVADAVATARNAGDGVALRVIAGSFYTVGPALVALAEQPS